MTSPTVSVAIPVYNGERFLGEAIESVLEQSFTDFELLVLDNCSTDATREIAERLARQDDRVRFLLNETNIGAAGNFNRAFEEARGTYFAWLASDDWWEADFLEECVRALDADPQVVLAFPMVRVVDDDDRELELVSDLDPLDSPRPERRLRVILSEPHNSYYIFGLLRASYLRNTRLILPHSHGDTILLARLALLGPFAKVDKYLFVSRRHTAQSNKMFLDRSRPGSFDFIAYSRWFAPPGKSTVEYPHSRAVIEFAKVPLGVSLGPISRLRVGALLLRLVRHYRRGLLADLRRFLSRLQRMT